MYKNIFINQCGYLPGMSKFVTIVSDHEIKFSLVKAGGTHVFSGVADRRIENEASKETVYIGDFSAVDAPGRYYVQTENGSESDIFEISDTVYDDLMQKTMKFFYLQRCGCDLPPKYAGMYAHPACHTKKAYVYGAADGDRFDVSGGWHDAGDYGRYIVPAGMAVAQLLLAYEANTDFFAQYSNPVGSGLPDYLEEVKYELDWMLKLQRPDGQVYHKSTCARFCGFIMPEDEKEDIILSPVSITATANFAASLALAVRFYEPYDKAYAAVLAEASKRAYASLSSIECNEEWIFKNPEGISTGGYGDRSYTDELYWAAAELYRAFGDETYRNDFEALANKGILHGYGWTNVASYGNLAYLASSYPTDEALCRKITDSMIALADEKLAVVQNDGYHTALKPQDYCWGSNLSVANFGIHLADAARLTGDPKYLTAAAAQLHYLLGRNPMGISYVSGCGTYSMAHPHHRPSGFLGKAMPGMLSGGPCMWRADAAAKAVLTPETPPAKAYVDMLGSYSTNEVTVYWNSALLMLLGMIV